MYTDTAITQISTEVPSRIARSVKQPAFGLLGLVFTCLSAEVTAQIARLAKQIATLCSLIWNFTCVSTEVGN